MRVEEQVEQFRRDYAGVEREVKKVIVGHEEVIGGVLMCLLSDGHALLEGVPGLGKTLLVRTLGQVLDLDFARIQFTPDLMPADITGTNIVMEDEAGRKHFEFQHGPLFANIILGDEINRATPKTQSAMLEAMQEHSVTVGGVTRPLPEPYVVMATQNPIEMEGTYPLPEAQLDRFMFKVLVQFPNLEELTEIVDRTTGVEVPEPQKVISAPRILEMRRLVREVPMADHVKSYIMRLVLATHPQSEHATEMVNRYGRYGASPRAAQALTLTGKVRALLQGRYNVAFEDVQAVAKPSLRHRIILNFEGEAEGITTDQIIEDILEKVPPQPELESVKLPELPAPAAGDVSAAAEESRR
ncbi:MAG: AAA family ATPase [Armatimonadota bacterium]